jgi:8-oxo-dGTP pyrophosphatase MutT (NUDIX family)
MGPTREALVTLLSSHTPEDDKERADLATMERLARELEAPFSPEQAVAHFTGSAVVVDPDGTRVCLIHHRKLGRWLQPGGHVEPSDTTMEAAAMREAHEETGLSVRPFPGASAPFDLDVHVIPAKGHLPAHLHLDVRFLLVADDPTRLVAQEAETLGARWFSFADALAAADEPAFRRMLRKCMRSCSQRTPA